MYERGEASIEVEVSRLQAWTENADVDLYGRNGDMGLIREFRDDRSQRIALMRFVRTAVAIMAALGGVPALIVILELLGIIHPVR